MNDIDWLYVKIARTLKKLKIKYQNSNLTPEKKLDQFIKDLENEFDFKFNKDEKDTMSSARDLVATMYLRFRK